MKSPFFPAMEQAGDRIVETPRLLLAVDYDGILTPLVDDPAKASLSSPMRQLLWSLEGREDVSVAILSGRKHTDLQDRIGISGVIYAGNHGLEITGPGFSFVEPTALQQSAHLKRIAAQLVQDLQRIPGVFVEDKGLTLSIHHRKVAAADREEVWRTVRAALANAEPLFRLAPGHLVYDIRPAISWDKAQALAWIKEQLGPQETLLLYLGDDITDEKVYAALHDEITVKIGDSAETAAHYVLAGPAEVQQFLEWVDQLRQKKALAQPQR